jgi:hypothetical protein
MKKRKKHRPGEMILLFVFCRPSRFFCATEMLCALAAKVNVKNKAVKIIDRVSAKRFLSLVCVFSVIANPVWLNYLNGAALK